MKRAKRSNSARGLKTSPPDLAAADFAEFHKIPRLFPKDQAERRCYAYLLPLMQASPDRQRSTKAELERYCRQRFGVTKRGFEYCWQQAIKASGASWFKPGRRPR